MSAELKIREALAAGPDAGPWFAQRDYSSWTIRNHEIAKNGFQQRMAAVGSPGRPTIKREAQNTATAAFIAACNPVAIAELLAELDRLRATPAPGAPAGFKLVPIEPTKAMIDAGAMHTTRDDDEEPYRARGEAIAAYVDMLAAAPGAPGQEAAPSVTYSTHN